MSILPYCTSVGTMNFKEDCHSKTSPICRHLFISKPFREVQEEKTIPTKISNKEISSLRKKIIDLQKKNEYQKDQITGLLNSNKILKGKLENLERKI